MEAERFTLYSIDDYLEREKSSEVRHEYLGGSIHAMSGASRRHNEIALAIAAELKRQLSGGPCKAYIEGVKVHIRTEVSDFFYYPDVVVGCDPSDANEFFLERPSVIVEVTSPATESTDRREKWLAYQTLDSLEHYLIVSQDRMSVEWLHRSDGEWKVTELSQGGEGIQLESLDVSLALEQIYEGITFDSESSPESN